MKELSKCFEIERMKINNEIHDERSAAHSHCTINKIEEDVREFISKIKKDVIENAIDGKITSKFVIDMIYLSVGDALFTKGDEVKG